MEEQWSVATDAGATPAMDATPVHCDERLAALQELLELQAEHTSAAGVARLLTRRARVLHRRAAVARAAVGVDEGACAFRVALQAAAAEAETAATALEESSMLATDEAGAALCLQALLRHEAGEHSAHVIALLRRALHCWAEAAASEAEVTVESGAALLAAAELVQLQGWVSLLPLFRSLALTLHLTGSHDAQGEAAAVAARATLTLAPHRCAAVWMFPTAAAAQAAAEDAAAAAAEAAAEDAAAASAEAVEREGPLTATLRGRAAAAKAVAAWTQGEVVVALLAARRAVQVRPV